MKHVAHLVLLGIACAGCVSIRGRLAAPTEPWPPAAPSGTLPSVSLFIEREVMGEEATHDTKIGAYVRREELVRWRDETLRAYRDSGLFSEVVAGLQDKDIKVHVVIRSLKDASPANAVLTGLTLFAIPLFSRVDLTVRSEFHRRDGAEASFEQSQSTHTVFELLLFPLAPFVARPQKVFDEVVYDLNRATLLQARERLAPGERPST